MKRDEKIKLLIKLKEENRKINKKIKSLTKLKEESRKIDQKIEMLEKEKRKRNKKIQFSAKEIFTLVPASRSINDIKLCDGCFFQFNEDVFKPHKNDPCKCCTNETIFTKEIFLIPEKSE